MQRPYIIGIAGPSCSGKTFLARNLEIALGRESVTRLALDSYYRDLSAIPPEERASQNFDAPGALDWELLRLHASLLAEGTGVDAPCYDFTRHVREERTELVGPRDFVLVEGLFALFDAGLRALYGTSVFVQAPDDLCLDRRLSRDVRERGRSRESVLDQYAATVRPMADLHVLPTRAWADLVVAGDGPIAETIDVILAHVEAGLGRAAR